MPAASRERFELAIMADQRICRTVMAELRLGLCREFGDDALGKDLAELDAPLVERIDVPDSALGKDTVLVKTDKLAERRWCQLLQQDRVGRPIAFERAVGHEPVGRALGADFLCRFAKGEGFAL